MLHYRVFIISFNSTVGDKLLEKCSKNEEPATGPYLVPVSSVQFSSVQYTPWNCPEFTFQSSEILYRCSFL